MKIIKILLVYLFAIGTVYGSVKYDQRQCMGTWELDIQKSKKPNTNTNPLNLSAFQTYLYFMVFKKNDILSIPGMNEDFNWYTESNNSITIDIKNYFLSGIVKSIDTNEMEIEFKNKKEKYRFFYKKTTPIKAKVEPLQNVLYQSRRDSKNYLFFLFNKNKYTLLNIGLSAREQLLFNKDAMKRSEKVRSDWQRTRGNYVVKDKKVYLFGVLGVSMIEMASQSKFKYQNRFIFEERTKKLKAFLSNNTDMFLYAIAHLDFDILKLSFQYGYTLTKDQKETLLFSIVDRYVDKNDGYDIKEDKRKQFMEVIKLLHQHGMKLDIAKKEYHPSIDYTDIKKPKQTLIKNLFYKEALLLVSLGVKVSNLDLYFLMTLNRKKVDRKILNKFLDAYHFNPKGENLIFSAIKYGDFDIEKRIFDMGFNNTKAVDCCFDLNVIDYILTFGKKSKYRFLKYVLSQNICSHSDKNINDTLKYAQTESKERDEKLIKILQNFIKAHKECLQAK